MARKTRPVTSREYKLMLQGHRFAGNQHDIAAAAENFRRDFAEAVAQIAGGPRIDSVVHGKLDALEEDKQVNVQFFDTKDRRLRNGNFVFRQRQPRGDGGRLELTLKRRHPDRFIASGTKTGGKVKFEEDIKATRHRDFISLHSLSGKVKNVAADTKFEKLKDIRSFFRPLKRQLGEAYHGSESLLRVCDFTAVQTVLEGLEFDLSEEIRAQCALIVWHRLGGDAATPAVVEFSFRYKDKPLGPKQEPFTAELARRCFDVFRALHVEDAKIAGWVDRDGLTKTAYTYSLTRA